MRVTGAMRLRRREFNELVRQAVQELPREVVRHLENVAVLVEDRARRGHMAGLGEQHPYDLFGLYVGVPLTDREGGPPPMPDTITLFQRPIEASCSSREEVVREVRITLLHEVGHYLGLGEEDLERLGYG